MGGSDSSRTGGCGCTSRRDGVLHPLARPRPRPRATPLAAPGRKSDRADAFGGSLPGCRPGPQAAQKSRARWRRPPRPGPAQQRRLAAPDAGTQTHVRTKTEEGRCGRRSGAPAVMPLHSAYPGGQLLPPQRAARPERIGRPGHRECLSRHPAWTVKPCGAACCRTECHCGRNPATAVPRYL